MTKVKIYSPATIANLVCGFDVLGLCLEDPCDEMFMELLDERKVIIHNLDKFRLPENASQNTAGLPLLVMLDELGSKVGFKLTIEKHIKPGSGIGSSAASAAGAVVAANHLLGNIFRGKKWSGLRCMVKSWHRV